jgi:xanthosine utilization system XapX-like protein
MRYTKLALLTFGAGLLLGLIVVVAEIRLLARVASGLMALGIMGIPIGIAADYRRTTRSLASPAAKRRMKSPVQRVAARKSRRPVRQRKRAIPKR